MDYRKILILFRKRIADKLGYTEGEKREGLIDAIRVLAELEAEAIGEDGGQNEP